MREGTTNAGLSARTTVRPRGGLQLTWLAALVGLSVVVLLAALAVQQAREAVQQAQEAARRTQCK